MDLHTISLEAAPLATLVAFRGVEEISRLFRFEIFVRTPPMVVLDEPEMLWSKAKLELRHDGAPDGVMAWHGVVRAVRLLEATSAIEGRLWQVTVVPAVYPKLALSRHSRVFTGKPLEALVEDLLQRCGLAAGKDVKLQLQGSYPDEEQVTQYRESDLDFLSRWLEHHGVRFWFEHGDDGDVMVISDATVDPTLRDKPVRTFGGGGDGDGSAGEVFRRFRSTRRTRPASVEVDDHDYGNPTLAAPERKTVSRDGLGRVRIFGERAVTPEYLAPTAARRAAMWASGGETFEAAGDVGGLRAGFSFEVEEHPREAMNGELLALRVEHEGTTSILSGPLVRRFGLHLGDGRLYEARVQAVRAGARHHPPLRTPRPQATGLERAIVDGPAGHHYAQIDDVGRYRVRFDFDEGDGAAGKASVAVRMMQMHAGNPEGMHFPLRKGTAVLVAFMGGDPDRPTIVGAAPDAHHPSPVTSANGTLNVVHTGSDTRLEIEDQKGDQFIALSAPPMTTRWHMGKPHGSSFQGSFTHHFVETTDGDCLFDFGGDQDVYVGAKLWEIVEDSVMEIYKTSLTTEITGPQTTHVTGPVIELYGATQTTEVTKLTKETYDAVQLTAVAGPRDETYVGGHQNETKSFVIELYAGAQTKEVSGKVTESYNGPLIQAVGGSTTQTFAGPVTTSFAPTVWIQDSMTFNIAGTATITTPSWIEIGSVHMSNDVMADAVRSTSTVVGTIGMAITIVLKAEQLGVLGEVTGLKAEASGPKILAALAHFKVVGLAFETRAAGKTYSAGFQKIN